VEAHTLDRPEPRSRTLASTRMLHDAAMDLLLRRGDLLKTRSRRLRMNRTPLMSGIFLEGGLLGVRDMIPMNIVRLMGRLRRRFVLFEYGRQHGKGK
jgi:hypothetical protein